MATSDGKAKQSASKPVDKRNIAQGSRGALSDLFAAASLGLVAGWYYLLISVALVLLYCVLALRSQWATFVLAALLIDMSVPYDNPKLSPNAFCNSWVFDAWRAYFGWETVIEQDLVPGEKYLMAEFPHALYPIGQLLSYGVLSSICPGQRVAGVVANVLLHTPILRHFYFATGTRSADASSIQAILKEGGSAAVVVGGIAEMFLDTSDAERIYLKKRKGFVRLALREGAHIIPVFFFGNTRTLRKVDSALLRTISRKLKMSIVIFYGRWGLPIPFRHPIKMVGGKHIRVEKCEEPSDELIERTLQRVIDTFVEMYEKHRPEWEKRPLVIV